MAIPKKATFRFSDSDLVSIEKLKAQGVKFSEFVMRDAATGQKKVICIPDLRESIHHAK
jgi:hypothetical protein